MGTLAASDEALDVCLYGHFWTVVLSICYMLLLSWELVGLVDHSHACKKCIHVKKNHVYKIS